MENSRRTTVRKKLAIFLSLAIIVMMVSSFGAITVSAASAWAPNTYYNIGDQVTYNGSTYQCIQAHTSLVGWEPPNVPALWQLVAGGSTPTPTPTPAATSTPTPTPTAGPTSTPTPTAVPTSTPTPTPVATATPTPASQFIENFSSGAANGWTTYDGTWAVENGEYSVVNGSNIAKSVLNTSFGSTVTLEGDINLITSGQASLLFDVSNPGIGTDACNCYVAGIDSAGSVWAGKQSNSWTSLGSTSATISTGTWYHLKIVAVPGNFKVYLNNTLKLDINDSTFTSGGMIGVRGGFSNHVHFDNITVFASATTLCNFSDGTSNGWTPYDGTWAVENGEYSVVNGSNIAKSIYNTPFSGSSTIEGDINLITSGQASLVFDVSNPGIGNDAMNGYVAGIDSAGNVWAGRQNGSWTPLASISASISTGTWYHLKIVAIPGNFKVYLNGALELDINDSTYTSGGMVGVRGGFGNHVHFDNIAASPSNVSSTLDIPTPVGNGVMVYQVQNGTRGAYADNQIYWGVIGINPSTGAWSYLDTNGYLQPISAALNDASGHLTKNGQNYANIYHTISEKSWVSLPAITSGRMFLSVGSPLYIKTYDNGYAGPDMNNPSDPNNDVYWDFVEFTLDAGGYHGNTTRVDAFGFPITHRLICNDGYDRTVGETETRAAIFSEYQNEVPAEFKTLVQAPYRIASPCKGAFKAGGTYGNYFDSYVNDIWNYYTSHELTFACQAGTYSGHVVGSDFVFSKNGGAYNLYIHGKPSTQDVLLGSGCLASGSDEEKVIEAQMCAAFNRHIVTDTANWANSGNFYKAAPANYYAQFWHNHSIGGLAYGFCYDDVNGYAAYLEHGGPKGLVINVGW